MHVDGWSHLWLNRNSWTGCWWLVWRVHQQAEMNQYLGLIILQFQDVYCLTQSVLLKHADHTETGYKRTISCKIENNRQTNMRMEQSKDMELSGVYWPWVLVCAVRSQT